MINQAIDTHQTWVRVFKEQLNSARFDINAFEGFNNFEICAFGKWLDSEEAFYALNKNTNCAFSKWLNSEEAHYPANKNLQQEISLKHIIFHELVADALMMIRRHASLSEIQNKIFEIDETSLQLIALLNSANR